MVVTAYTQCGMLLSWCGLPNMQADKYGVPRICFVNKMDRMGADFFNTVKMIVSNLAATPAVLQVQGAGFRMHYHLPTACQHAWV